jgi:very-short-patch-repair endonuclease
MSRSRIERVVIGQCVDPDKVLAAKQLRRTMTVAEKILWNHVRANRLDGFHFRRQQIIAGYVVDFYCHSARLIVELDGPIHENQHEHDKKRDIALTELGFRIVRFANREVIENLKEVLNRILRHCQEKIT